MIEAEVTCICTSIRLDDLGLDLTRGQVIHLGQGAAEASRALEQARRAGGVRIRYVERCQERRDGPAVPPTPTPVFPAAFVPHVPLVPTRPALDVDDLVQRLLVGLQTQGDVDVEGRIAAALAPLDAKFEGLKGEILAVVREALSNGRVVRAHGGQEAGIVDDTPVFIPNDLGGKGLSADISVKEAAGQGSTVDDATAALRAIRQGSAPKKESAAGKKASTGKKKAKD